MHRGVQVNEQAGRWTGVDGNRKTNTDQMGPGRRPFRKADEESRM